MIGLIFPHQLFEDISPWKGCEKVYLMEEYLFFRQYNFHKQKLAYHRASMKFYEQYLLNNGLKVAYIEANQSSSDVRMFLAENKDADVRYIDTVDNWLEKRIKQGAATWGLTCQKLSNPSFLNTEAELWEYYKSYGKLYQTDFYKKERLKRNVLLDEAKKPIGGQWTYDVENRKKYPKGLVPPPVHMPQCSAFWQEAKEYVQTNFPNNVGLLTEENIYPIGFEASKAWLNAFFEQRFFDFGIYEDAIVAHETVLNHSLLTPMLNTGLLTPAYVLEACLSYAEVRAVPLNSLEGFVRQVTGWREYIRMVYMIKGTEERTKNYWQFSRKIPESFYTGTTGIVPIDTTIKKVLAGAYCHHIERLMVLGNFMLLCEFDPDEVYRWFMELYIDAYDWVMVPNVYGMSQFADGGLMATKPYISSSNYLMKMSDYPAGTWQQTWDALFWRFMHMHRDFFMSNPRLGMLIKTFDNWDKTKQDNLLAQANQYLLGLG